MKDETGKIVFDAEEQVEVDRIIGERLARAKAEKPADYDDLKEIEKEIGDFFQGATPAEKKEAIRTYKQQIKAQQELAELEEQAKATGKDPELLKEIKALKDEIAEIKGERQATKQAEESKKQADAAWNTQVKEFQEKHEDIDLEKLNENASFVKFLSRSNPKMTLTQVYEHYVEIINDTEKAALEKAKTNADRSTSSGKEKGGGNYGLTERQMQLAKDNGMTYKEYAESLSLVKK